MPVVQRDVERVVDDRTVALDPDISADRLRHAKQEQRLIEQVRPDVEPDAGARVRLLAPRIRLELGAKAIEMRFVRGDAAKIALAHNVADGREIAGIATILIDRHDAPLRPGELDQLPCFRKCRREGLVDDHMMSREQTLFRNGMVRRIRRRDNDEIDLAFEHLVDTANEFDIGISRIGGAVALHDRREQQAVHGADDRRVKHFAGETKPDQTHVEHDRVCHQNR